MRQVSNTGPLSGNFPVSDRGQSAVYLTCPRIANDYKSLADGLQFNRVRPVSNMRALSENLPVSDRCRSAFYLTCPKIAKDV